MNDDGRGGDEYGLHSELLPETVQSRGGLDFYKREARAELGGTEQPSRGQQSRLHTPQQRDGTSRSPDARVPGENRTADIQAVQRGRYEYERRDEKKVFALGAREVREPTSSVVGN